MAMDFPGPICQSCAMPLKQPEDFGTEGYRINDYCCRCYQNGSLTQPGITMQEMIEICAGMITEYRVMQRDQALSLKCWRQG